MVSINLPLLGQQLVSTKLIKIIYKWIRNCLEPHLLQPNLYIKDSPIKMVMSTTKQCLVLEKKNDNQTKGIKGESRNCLALTYCPQKNGRKPSPIQATAYPWPNKGNSPQRHHPFEDSRSCRSRFQRERLTKWLQIALQTYFLGGILSINMEHHGTPTYASHCQTYGFHDSWGFFWRRKNSQVRASWPTGLSRHSGAQGSVPAVHRLQW